MKNSTGSAPPCTAPTPSKHRTSTQSESPATTASASAHPSNPQAGKTPTFPRSPPSKEAQVNKTNTSSTSSPASEPKPTISRTTFYTGLICLSLGYVLGVLITARQILAQ